MSLSLFNCSAVLVFPPTAYPLILPQWVMDNCSGFSIVRAERDVRIVTQGLSTQLALPSITYGLGNHFSGTLAPNESIGLGTNSNFLSYISPDNLSGTPLNSAWNADGAYVEEAGWLAPVDYVLRGGATLANTFVSSQLPSGAWRLAAEGDGHDDIVMGCGIGLWQVTLLDPIKLVDWA